MQKLQTETVVIGAAQLGQKNNPLNICDISEGDKYVFSVYTIFIQEIKIGFG
ncbi:hypothetical protein ACPA1T_16080 [Bacillus amyloliquefaciens]|uniref:hypothetical protein n=1 Tax=Bacillus amyloliquefaciens TaxID=1390 RepID=UPI003C756AF9